MSDIEMVGKPENIKGDCLLVGGPYDGVTCDPRGGSVVLVVFRNSNHVYRQDTKDSKRFNYDGISKTHPKWNPKEGAD